MLELMPSRVLASQKFALAFIGSTVRIDGIVSPSLRGAERLWRHDSVPVPAVALRHRLLEPVRHVKEL
jgi:hypothetical protein